MSEIVQELAESKRKVLQILEENDKVNQDLQYTLDDIKTLKKDSVDQMKELEEMSKEFNPPPVPKYSELLQTHTSRTVKAKKYSKQFKKWFKELNKRERKLAVQTGRDIITRRNYNRLAVKLNDMKEESRKLRAERSEMIYALEQWQELLLDKDQTLVSTLKREEIHVRKLRFKLAIYQIEDERRSIAIRNLFEEFKDYGVKDFRKHYDQCIKDLELERQFYQKLDKKFNSLDGDSSDPWDDLVSGRFLEEEDSLGGWRLNAPDLRRKQLELQEFSRILLNKGLTPGGEEFSKTGELKVLEDYQMDVLLRSLYVRKKMFRGENVDEVDVPEPPRERDHKTLTDIVDEIRLVEDMTEKFDKQLLEQNFVLENLENGSRSILTKIHQRDHAIRRIEKVLKKIEDELEGEKDENGNPTKTVSIERRLELESKRDGFTQRLKEEIKTKHILLKLHQKQKMMIRKQRVEVESTEKKLLSLAQKRVNLNEQKFRFLERLGEVEEEEFQEELKRKKLDWKKLVKEDEMFDIQVKNEEEELDQQEEEEKEKRKGEPVDLEKDKEELEDEQERKRRRRKRKGRRKKKKRKKRKKKKRKKKKGPAKKEREGETSEGEEKEEGEEEVEGEEDTDDEDEDSEDDDEEEDSFSEYSETGEDEMTEGEDGMFPRKRNRRGKKELTEEEKNREEFKDNLKQFVKNLRRPSTSLGVAKTAVVRDERVLNMVDVDKIKEESKKKVFPKPLLKKIRSFESLTSMKEKRMELMKEFYKAREERMNSIVGDEADIREEIETEKLIKELEKRIKAQKEYIQNLKDMTDRDWAMEKNQDALKIFSGDEKYQKIKFLRRHKYCQTTPLNIDQSIQATTTMRTKRVQAGKSRRKRRRTAVMNKALPLHMRKRMGGGGGGGIPMTAIEGKKKEDMQLKLLDSVFSRPKSAMKSSNSIDMSMWKDLRSLEDVENALDLDKTGESKNPLVRTGTSDDLDLEMMKKKKGRNFGLGVSVNQLKSAKNAILEKKERMKRKDSKTEFVQAEERERKKMEMKRMKEQIKRDFREFADDIDLSVDTGVQAGEGGKIKKMSTIAIQYEELEGVPRKSASDISLTVVSVSVQADEEDINYENRPPSPVFSPLVGQKKKRVSDENRFPSLQISIPRKGAEKSDGNEKMKRLHVVGSRESFLSPSSPIDIGMKSTGQQYDPDFFLNYVKEKAEEMKPETGTTEVQVGHVFSELSCQGVQTQSLDYEINEDRITPTTIEFVKKLMRVDNVSREIQCDLIVVSFGTTESTTQCPVPKTKSTAPKRDQECQTPFKYVPDEAEVEVQTTSTRFGVDEDEVERLQKERAKLKVEYGNLRSSSSKGGDEYGSVDVEAPVIDIFGPQDNDDENDFEISNTPLPAPRRPMMKKVDSVTISPLPPSQKKKRRMRTSDSVEIELRVPGDEIFDLGMKRIKSFEVFGGDEEDENEGEEEEDGEIFARTPLERSVLVEKKKILERAMNLKEEKLKEEEMIRNDIEDKINELNETREQQKEEERRRRKELYEEEERLKKMRKKQQDEYDEMLRKQEERAQRLQANREEFQRAWDMNEESWREDGKKRAERRRKEKEWADKEIKLREDAEKVKEEMDRMKELEKRRKEKMAREERRRKDEKLRKDQDREKKEEMMKIKLLDVTRQKEKMERQINDILKRSSKIAQMVTNTSMRRVNSIDFSCQSPSSWLIEDRKRRIRDQMSKVESDIHLLKKSEEMNKEAIRKGIHGMKRVSSFDTSDKIQKVGQRKRKKRRRRRTDVFTETTMVPKLPKPKVRRRARSRETTPRKKTSSTSTSTGTETETSQVDLSIPSGIRRRTRSMKVSSSLERLAEKIRTQSGGGDGGDDQTKTTSTAKNDIQTEIRIKKKMRKQFDEEIEKAVSEAVEEALKNHSRKKKVRTRTVAVSKCPEQRNVKLQVDTLDPDPDQRNVGIQTRRQGDYFLQEKRWWVQEVRTVGTNTKDRSKENWYRMTHTRNVGTFFSPPFKHQVSQCIPSRGSVEVQAVCQMTEQVTQFPQNPPTFQDIPVQTSAMSYLKYKVIRTRDKFCQAELSKVRFRLLERIPSQELGFTKSWRERHTQTPTIKKVNRPVMAKPKQFNVNIEVKPYASNCRTQTMETCFTENLFYKRYHKMMFDITTQYEDPYEHIQRTTHRRIQTLPYRKFQKDRSCQTKFTLSNAMLRGTDAESREILRKFHSTRPTSADDSGRFALESSYISRQNIVIQKLTKKLRHQASLRNDNVAQHQRRVQHMKEQYKALLDGKSETIQKLKSELEKVKYQKVMSTKLERSNMQAARNQMKNLENDKSRIRHDWEDKLRSQRNLYEQQIRELKNHHERKSVREENLYKAGIRQMEKEHEEQKKKLYVAHQQKLDNLNRHNDVVKRIHSEKSRLKNQVLLLEEQNAVLRKKNNIQRDQGEKSVRQYRQIIRNLKERMRSNPTNPSRSGLEQSEYIQNQIVELAEREINSKVEGARQKWVISSKEKENEWSKAYQIQEKRMKKLNLALKMERDSWDAKEERYNKGRERMRTENERLKQVIMQKEVENKKLKEYFQKLKNNPFPTSGGGVSLEDKKRGSSLMSSGWNAGRKRSTIPDMNGLSVAVPNSVAQEMNDSGGGGRGMFPQISMAPTRLDFFEDDDLKKRRRAAKSISYQKSRKHRNREFGMKSQLKHEKGGPAPGRLVFGEFGKKRGSNNIRKKKKNVSSFKLSGIQLDL